MAKMPVLTKQKYIHDTYDKNFLRRTGCQILTGLQRCAPSCAERPHLRQTYRASLTSRLISSSSSRFATLQRCSSLTQSSPPLHGLSFPFPISRLLKHCLMPRKFVNPCINRKTGPLHAYNSRARKGHFQSLSLSALPKRADRIIAYLTFYTQPPVTELSKLLPSDLFPGKYPRKDQVKDGCFGIHTACRNSQNRNW